MHKSQRHREAAVVRRKRRAGILAPQSGATLSNTATIRCVHYDYSSTLIPTYYKAKNKHEREKTKKEVLGGVLSDGREQLMGPEVCQFGAPTRRPQIPRSTDFLVRSREINRSKTFKKRGTVVR